ncbi:putative RNA polymerase II subunit B1 CTD phosphatase RPAP2 isoform X2 [Littorina saxatilis]|uniref:RNA polymerase II subunit B1 CTD phosphatase RPAP2 homolog n=1 Tax=Littorina saxatilis TaxID=31220 RepID=A0AAN9B6R1_9CAEN
MGETDEKHSEKTSPQRKKKSSSQPKRNYGDRGEKQEKEDADHHKKAEMETKIRERVACEAKAFDVINRLIESGITAEYLLEACRFIDHSHYGDIVEERTIGHLCGYPVCSNKLAKVAKKKYHISTRTNTVYDITERKKFCSNECYRSSQYLQKQIPQTPVWTRRNEPAIKIELLQPEPKRTLEGEEVIGSSMFSLKEEVAQLEKMDRKTKESTSTAKHKPQSHTSLKESQRLSDRLLSLSTEGELGSKMENLCLGGKDEKVPEHKISGASPEASLSVAESKGERNVAEDGSASEAKSVGLESAIENLTLKDETAQNAADSDDDEIEKEKNGDGSLVEPKDSSANTTLQHTTRTDHCEKNQKPVATTIKQQPGESKAAYMMRLLDKRQKLFSKVADIQDNAKPQPSDSLQPPAEDKEKIAKKDNAKILEINSDEKIEEKQNQSPSEKEERKASKSTKDTDSSILSTKQVGKKNMPHTRASSASLKPVAKVSPESSQPQVSPLSSVCRIISEWFTPEALTYLGLVTPQGQSDVEDYSSSFLHKDPEMQKKYAELCHRLAGQDKQMGDILGEDNVEEKETMSGRRPLPNFDELKNQTEEYQVKMQQFFPGPSAARKKKAEGDGGDNEDAPVSNRPVVLPVIDSQNQLLIRRRIVLERLDRTMPSLLSPLGLAVLDVSASLRELVYTFSLTAHNIVFKPAEWTLVAIILLRVLAARSQVVASAFQSESRCSTLNLVLSHLGDSCSSLGQLVDDMLSQRKQQLQDEVLH